MGLYASRWCRRLQGAAMCAEAGIRRAVGFLDFPRDERPAVPKHRRRSRGAEFITEPMDKRGETCCYMRDPDGYIIEVEQSKPGFASFKGCDTSSICSDRVQRISNIKCPS
jgi:hypothetical protein